MRRLLIFVFPMAFLVSCQKPASLSLGYGKRQFSRVPKAGEVRKFDVGSRAGGWRGVGRLPEGRVALRDTYRKVRTRSKVIALTFDDGPHPRNTPRLLDLLRDRNVRATFFVVGNMVHHHPELLRRMVAEGHEIGNHTATHGTMTGMSDERLLEELVHTHNLIVRITGMPPRCMRPPGGAVTDAQKRLVFRDFGYPTILWSCDPQDWKRPGVSVVASRLIEGATPGAILLAHDLHGPTVDAMPQTLDALIGRGYDFLTVSELIALDSENR